MTAPLSDDQRDRLAARIYAERDMLPSTLRNPRFGFTRGDAERLADVILRSEWFAAMLAEARAEALRDAATAARAEKLHGVADQYDWANWLNRRAALADPEATA